MFLFVAFAAVALSPDRRRLQYSCQTWTHKDKPSANGINQTSRSPGGYFWVNAGTHQSVSSINTKPGDYCFQVLARSEESAWSPVGVGFAVGLLPHYSQTTWFTVMAGGLMAAGLLGVYSRRVKQWARTQKQLQEAHDLLEAKVRERTAQLAESNVSLFNEIEERKRTEVEVRRIHKQLMQASRQAGQVEIASSILHNVANVLNSVNVSTTLIGERVRKIRVANLTKAAQLLQGQNGDLSHFLNHDERGRLLPKYLEELAEHLVKEQSELLDEIKELSHNLEHIKEIVAMQQSYAKVSGVVEKVALVELIESAFKMHAGAFERHLVKAVREFKDSPQVVVDRHKVLQILVNILQNAKYACVDSGRAEKRIILRIKKDSEDRIRIEISDNGIGIAPQNLARIFSHGFTTRKDGHGFGLHSAALAAKEMGGELRVQSDGVGMGATFILELPSLPPVKKSAERNSETTEFTLAETREVAVSS